MQEDHDRPEHTNARLEDLWQHGVLDTPPEPEFDRLTQLAASLTGAPVALVSLVDECRQFFKSSVGLPEPWRTRRETPLTHSFCALVVQDHTPLVIEDARTDPRVAGNLAIPDLGVIAYLGIPLTSASGSPLGSFCVIDHKPRKWTPLEIERMTQLASAVTSELRLRGILAQQATENLRLSIARADAEETLRVRGEFLSRFSHELRTPLSAVIGYSDILKAELLEAGNSEWAEYSEHVSVAGQHLLDLVNDILDFARIDAGLLEISPSSIDLAALLHEVKLTVNASIIGNGNRLIVHVAEALPPLTADAVRLKQILINLLGNAAKFTRSGTISLTVTEVTWQEAPTLEFRVVDTGIGMEPEQLARLFQPFVQASKKIGATYGGTGLGLAISQRYARAMGGDIEAHSEPGVGSEFILRIPRGSAVPAPGLPSA
jgi:signal transduction histidine kinase